MFIRSRKGQNTLEYALLVTAALLAAIYGANTIIKDRAKKNMDAAGSILDKARTELETATETGGDGT